MSARHDDYRMDWRAPRPKMAVRRKPALGQRIRAGVLNLFQAFRAVPGGEPSNWRDAAVFIVGTVWGGMVAYGMLLAIAARHAP